MGESLVDVVVDADGDTEETPGGSPLNVAVGLARLDVPATLITQVGLDERGGMVVHHVEASGVEIVAAPPSSGRTSTAIARLDAAGLARYEFDLEWSLPRQELPPCRALHVGSLGTAIEPGRESVLDLVAQAVDRELFVSFDANLRESFVEDAELTWGQVRSLGARCTLVKLSDEDADLLAPGTDPDEVARTLLAGERTELVLLTRGAQGATAFTPAETVSVTPRRVEVVDTVGAGDAFMAATLAQLADGDSFRDGLDTSAAALERLACAAVEVAAITCERRGANPPRRQELPPGWPS
ncbi:MAG: carbohydrate kinase [Marmoricola sp.]|nr:carbohydrate kinase [Marmoricola sp.]